MMSSTHALLRNILFNIERLLTRDSPQECRTNFSYSLCNAPFFLSAISQDVNPEQSASGISQNKQVLDALWHSLFPSQSSARYAKDMLDHAGAYFRPRQLWNQWNGK